MKRKHSGDNEIHIHALVLIVVMLVLLMAGNIFAMPIIEGERMHPVEGKNGMVVTSHYLATESAVSVLKKGGNAIDAAVTAAFTLAVTQPRSGNIGGGGFMLISSEKRDEVVSIDYREKAPLAATVDMFLDEKGQVNTEASRFSHLSAGVPGTVAGLALALEKYGTISLAKALQPAIILAEKGFVVSPRFSDGLKKAEKRLKKWDSSRRVFFKDDGGFYEPGEFFVQPDLAKTLQRIAINGAREFYTGITAKMIAEEMRKHGGYLTRDDLQGYSPVLRKPVHGKYRGYDVYSMGPPSSGGVHVIQLLNILEYYDIGELRHNSAQSLHYMTEAMKLAYVDRSKYLGDSDFVDVPVEDLVSKNYALHLRKKILRDSSTPAQKILPGKPNLYESDETTHFSIVDSYGNAVSNTYTINFSYGSGIVVDGAGFLLNNEMDDFSAKPGVPNSYGLIGGEANKIEPSKRMLSSMSPTIVKKKKKNFLVTGSPGGSRIITTTLQVIMNVIDHGLNIQSAVSVPRIHHQWLPDELRIEEGISSDTTDILQNMGHNVVQKRSMGAIQSIVIQDGVMYGGADPRRSTSSAQGY